MHVARAVTFTSDLNTKSKTKSKTRERTKLKRFRFAVTLGQSEATGARQWTFAGLKYPTLQGAVDQAQRQPLRFNTTIIKMLQPAKGATAFKEPPLPGPGGGAAAAARVVQAAAGGGGGGARQESQFFDLARQLTGLGIRDDDLPIPVDTRPEPPAAQGARVLVYSVFVLLLAVAYGYCMQFPEESEALYTEFRNEVHPFFVNIGILDRSSSSSSRRNTVYDGSGARASADAAATVAMAAAAAAAAAADPQNAISDYFSLSKSKYCQPGTIPVTTVAECKTAAAKLGVGVNPDIGEVWSPGMRCYKHRKGHTDVRFVSMLSNRADDVMRKAVCKKGCHVQRHWCDAAFEYTRADCTGDGLLDHVCVRLDGSVFVQAAAAVCDGTDAKQLTSCGNGTPNEMAQRRHSAAVGPWTGYYLTTGWPQDENARRSAGKIVGVHPIVWCAHVSRSRLQCRGVREREAGVVALTPQHRGWALDHDAVQLQEATSELTVSNVGTDKAFIELASLAGSLKRTQGTPQTEAIVWSDGSSWTKMAGLWTLGASGAVTCPANYVPIDSREECEHAAEQLGYGAEHAITPPEAAAPTRNQLRSGRDGTVEPGYLYPAGFGKNKVHKYYRECVFTYTRAGVRDLRLQRPSTPYKPRHTFGGSSSSSSSDSNSGSPGSVFSTEGRQQTNGEADATAKESAKDQLDLVWHGPKSRLLCRAHASSFKEWVHPGSTNNGAHLWYDHAQVRDPAWRNKKHGGALHFAQTLQVAAANGIMLGANNYATMQLFGNLSSAIPRNATAARATFARLAAEGYPPAQHMVGFVADVGIGGPRNTSSALLHAAFSSMGSNTFGKLSHARRLLMSSSGGACEQALPLYRDIANVVEEGLTVAGEGRRAEKRLPYDMRQGNVREDTVSYWLLSASNGDQAAQFQLGEVYYFGGWGEDQNYTKAFEHFMRARGLVGAQARLGEMYAYGLGVNVNYQKAFGLLQTAANRQNHGRASDPPSPQST